VDGADVLLGRKEVEDGAAAEEGGPLRTICAEVREQRERARRSSGRGRNEEGTKGAKGE
jgi:hypothetical protein